jgi:hypothetical protein
MSKAAGSIDPDTIKPGEIVYRVDLGWIIKIHVSKVSADHIGTVPASRLNEWSKCVGTYFRNYWHAYAVAMRANFGEIIFYEVKNGRPSSWLRLK